MKICTVTVGLPLRWPPPAGTLERVGSFLATARVALGEAGYEVQTTRLATQPAGDLLAASGLGAGDLVGVAGALEAACREQGIDYVSLGTILPQEEHRPLLALVPEVMATTKRVFLTATVATPAQGVHMGAVRAAARAVREIAARTPGGFGNHNFAMLANCPPGIPFFPAAYHGAAHASFTLGLEAASLVYDACAAADEPSDARARLVGALEEAARTLQGVAEQLAAEHGLAFDGLDASTAPFPGPTTSTAAAIELLTGAPFGSPGTLGGAALVADALRRARFRKAGYCGLFLPVLEDSVLAARHAEGTYTLDTLLLYSAVCGAGLDAVPLPGATTEEELAAIMMDVAALSTVLGKPLSARLIPLPGKEAGESTTFEYTYFANTRVFPARLAGTAGLLGAAETLAFTRAVPAIPAAGEPAG